MTDTTTPDSTTHDGPAPVSPTPDVNAEISATSLPTAAELHRRASLPRQAFRFAVLNLKILKLSRQHH